MRLGSFSMKRTTFLYSAAVLLMLTAVGCSDKGDGKPKIRKRDGVVASIDLANRKVSMKTQDKSGNPQVLPGTFRDDTVVIINGRNMTLKDIRVGDKVSVHGYKEGEGLSQSLIATRVEVDRPEEQDWKTPGQGEGSSTPTTQPAGD